MKNLFILFTLLVTNFAFANYQDVIKMEPTGNCTIDEMVEIKDDFNNVMQKKGYDYRAKIWVPTFATEGTLNHVYWIGTAPDLPDFASEFTRYFEEVTKGSTPEAGIETAFGECRVEVSRSGFQAR